VTRRRHCYMATDIPRPIIKSERQCLSRTLSAISSNVPVSESSRELLGPRLNAQPKRSEESRVSAAVTRQFFERDLD
jgi:hypothetical protein